MRCMICSTDMVLENTAFEDNKPAFELWRCPNCQSGFKVNLKKQWVKM